MEALKRQFPGRESQIDQLYNLFGYDEPFIDSTYIYGGPGVGKSSIVTSILTSCRIKYALVNLIECYTSKILYETILNRLSGHRIDPFKGQPYAKCDNMMDFVANLRKCSSENDLDGSVIVLDKSEQLRNMDFNLLAGFLRFRELCGLSISVVFVSEIPFQKYYTKTNIVEPIKIYFPQYNKETVGRILTLDFEKSVETIADYEEFGVDLDFYKNYLNVFLSVFYRACRDLAELRYMARLNFDSYCRPVLNKDCEATDSLALWRRIAPVLKASLESLYLRISAKNENSGELHTLTFSKENMALSLELPFYAKYLLIAAYLASYNPAKEDKRLFMKYHGKKTKTLKDVKAKNKVSEKLNTQLGPKAFGFDRLLAIFYSILEEKVNFNNNLLAQVSTLVELQLLSVASDGCNLDGQKYKCTVSFDFIQSVAKMVGFNIRKYLVDFSYM